MAKPPMKPLLRQVGRALLLLALAGLALQLYFVARIGLMGVLDPESTTFQRSEITRLVGGSWPVAWSQQWVDADRISPHLKRAVIASEDAGFVEHSGVEWDAIEAAMDRNQRAEAAAERLNARRGPAAKRPPVQPKLVGGSTITQQLAKNLFLSGERTVLRKGQELVLALLLDALLSKDRQLVLYLNHVEWGEGLFGAQAAARYYFKVDAARLSPEQAARLAVMLPAPKRFETRPGSPYLRHRAAVILRRMGGVEVPP